jgi:hypothetical protein
MKFFRLALACCVSMGAGCNMCQAPYDYCGPTLNASGQPVGSFGTRVGSVWADDTRPREARPQPPVLSAEQEGAADEEAPAPSSTAGNAPRYHAASANYAEPDEE